MIIPNQYTLSLMKNQHYSMSEGWGGEEKLKLVQLRDKIKTNYCKDNDIKHLRIKYNENITEKLKLIYKL
jgi:uncharacterized protein YktA (UPF0223 family)